MWKTELAPAPEKVATEIQDIQNKIKIAVIDFNLTHNYQASKVFIPKEEYNLILLSEGYAKIFENFNYKRIPDANGNFTIEPHPLETIKEIIVI